LDRAHYILRDRKPVRASLFEWAAWFEKVENRRVAETTIGDIWVSTVFLGIDLNCSDKGPPLLFETMVFDEPVEKRLFGQIREVREELDLRRTATWDDAIREHERACFAIREALREAEEITGAVLRDRGKKERCL
jgi:hypothetical protein